MADDPNADTVFPVLSEPVDAYPQIGHVDNPSSTPDQVIPTSVVPAEAALPLEKATQARLEGYSWPEIDGHVANVRQTAEQFGYDQKDVDAQLGYKDPTPTLN